MNNVVAAVLAGGLGTRLRSVIADRPKVLAPVGGRPFLTHLLDQLARAGVARTVLLTGYGSQHVRAAIDESHAGMAIDYSQEPEPLGTGGALRFALPCLDCETVLLLNGDSYCDASLEDLLKWHSRRGAAATLTLTHVENASRFGRVDLGESQRIERFAEKQPTPSPGWINAGVYAFHRRLIESIPQGCAVSLERDVLPNWVVRGEVFGVQCCGEFIDIGVPESYALADALFAHRPQSTIPSPIRAGNRL